MSLFKQMISALTPLCLLGLAACGSSEPAPGYAPVEAGKYDSFQVASVSSDELSTLRGGFLYAGGLRIDFGLTSSTFINGIPQSHLNISSINQSGKAPISLQQLVQTVNSTSATVTGASTLTSPGTTPFVTTTFSNNVLTVIQNHMNNTTIQNQNVLRLTVSNLANIHSQAAILNGVGPLVRALH